MPLDPNAIVNSPAPALVLSLVFLGLFIAGVIVRGALVDALLSRLDRMTDTLQERNRLDEERLRWEKDHEERRSMPRPRSE